MIYTSVDVCVISLSILTLMLHRSAGLWNNNDIIWNFTNRSMTVYIGTSRIIQFRKSALPAEYINQPLACTPFSLFIFSPDPRHQLNYRRGPRNLPIRWKIYRSLYTSCLALVVTESCSREERILHIIYYNIANNKNNNNMMLL